MKKFGVPRWPSRRWPWTATSTVQVRPGTFAACHSPSLSPLVSCHLSTVKLHDKGIKCQQKSKKSTVLWMSFICKPVKSGMALWRNPPVKHPAKSIPGQTVLLSCKCTDGWQYKRVRTPRSSEGRDLVRLSVRQIWGRLWLQVGTWCTWWQ